MDCYNAITNSYCDDNEVMDVIIPPRIPPVLFNWDTTAKFSEVYTMQQAQNDQLASLHIEQGVQNDAIDVLQDGLLQRVHYEQPGLGGGHLLFTPGQEYTTDVSTGETGLIPSSAKLESYDAAGTIGSSITLQGELITLDGILELSGTTADVGGLLLEHSTKIHNLEIEAAVTTAAELAVEAALAALEAASFLKPPGYAPIEDVPPGETDPNSTSVDPLTLAPSGEFAGVDAFGAITHTTVARGKVGINNTFPLRSLDLKGDIRQQATDADDIVELQSLCRFASTVAQYDAQQNLTNPNAAAVYLGTNALVDCSGTIQAEGAKLVSVTSSSIGCNNINGTNVVRTLHAAQGPASKDYSRDIAKQAVRISRVQRSIKPSFPVRDVSEDIVRMHAELALVRRQAFGGVHIPTKDFSEDIVRMHALLDPVRSKAFSSVHMPTQDFSMAVAHLKGRSAQHDIVLTPDCTRQLKQVSAKIVTVQKLIKPVLTKNYDKQISELKSSAVTLSRRIKPVLAPNYSIPLKQVSAKIVAVQKLIKPVLTKNYDKQISALKSSIATSSSGTTAAITAVRRSIKPTVAAKSYDAPIALLKKSVSTLSAVSAVSRLRPSIIQDTSRKAVELYKRQLAAASATASAAITSVDHLYLTNNSSSIAGLSTDTTIPTGKTWIRVGYFYYRFSGDIRIRISSNDTDRVFDQVTLSLDYNRSQGDGALDFQATLKHSNAYFTDRGISRVAVTSLDYGSFRNHSVYFLGPSAYSYDISVSAVPYGSNPYADQFFIDRPPVYEAPTVATYITYFECKQRTDFAGSVNFQNGLYMNGNSMPYVEHINTETGYSGLNTVNTSGAQTVKTQAIGGYNFVAKGTGVVIELQGMWYLTGSGGSSGFFGGGMIFSAALGTDNPYYQATVAYGYQPFSVSTKRYTVAKGSTNTINVIYQAVGDGSINGSLTVKHATIYHYP
jgi:hypothetical protein